MNETVTRAPDMSLVKPAWILLIVGVVGTWIVWWIGLMIFGASLVGVLSTVN